MLCPCPPGWLPWATNHLVLPPPRLLPWHRPACQGCAHLRGAGQTPAKGLRSFPGRDMDFNHSHFQTAWRGIAGQPHALYTPRLSGGGSWPPGPLVRSRGNAPVSAGWAMSSGRVDRHCLWGMLRQVPNGSCAAAVKWKREGTDTGA